MKDVFTIQSQIAQLTADAMNIHLTTKTRSAIHKSPTTNFEAYNFYLKGYYFLDKWSGEGSKTCDSIF